MIEVGMDQHKRFSLAASYNCETGLVQTARLEHDNPQSIRNYVRSLGQNVRASLETTGNWYWLVDLLEQEGVQVQLCNNVETRRLLKARAKNDRLDAIALAELSAQGLLPCVYVPPAQMRDARERHRYRIRLVGMRSVVKNQVHAILSKLNIRAPGTDLFGKKGRAFLDQLTLREPYGDELAGSLRIIELLSDQIKQIEKGIAKNLKDDPRSELLQSIPGIGKLTAHLILYEVGPVERFPTHKQFVSYCSLAPGTWQSAGRRKQMPVGRRGNLYLKAALSESTQTAVRYDNSLGAYYRRLRQRKGTGKAMMATARKLAVAVYYVLRRGERYRPAASIQSTSGKPVLCLGRQ